MREEQVAEELMGVNEDYFTEGSNHSCVITSSLNTKRMTTV